MTADAALLRLAQQAHASAGAGKCRSAIKANPTITLNTPAEFLIIPWWMQVSFFRSNLMLRVVPKPTGKTPDGKPADLEALVNYIR